MGTQTLLGLPETAPWNSLRDLIGSRASAARVIVATLEASRIPFQSLPDNAGIQSGLGLLLRVCEQAHLGTIGAALPGLSAGFQTADLLGEFAATLRQEDAGRTDFGQLAVRASLSTLSRVVASADPQHAGGETKALTEALARLGGPRGLARLSREFFAHYMFQYVCYFVGRELPLHAGPGGAFPRLEDQVRYRSELRQQCERAVIGVEPATLLRLVGTGTGHLADPGVEKELTRVALGEFRAAFSRVPV